jgi:probable HAF family extracellular repeat protein
MQGVVCALWVLTMAPCAHAGSIFVPPPAVLDGSVLDGSTSVAGVSTDGSVVVGISAFINVSGYGGPPNTCQAYRWTAGTGTVGLGHLPGDSDSTATAVSGDGSVVVGVSAPSFDLAGAGAVDGRVLSSGGFTVGQTFRWTAGSGMVGLGHLPGSTNNSPVAVSSNGSVIIGTSYSASGVGQAFRWTAGSGMVGLGYLPGGTNSSASYLSADGSVIVGTSYSASGGQAFRWTAGSGMVGLGNLPGGTNISAAGLSADGFVIVGTSYSASGDQAFRWTAASGMVGLGYLPGDTNSQASAISADGSVIVGASISAIKDRAFRWTAGLGMVALGTNNSGASCVSSDGSVIIGYYENGMFRWTAGSGMQNLYDFLVANGADPAGIYLGELDSAVMSANGNTIFGYGIDDPIDEDIYYYVATVPGLIGVPPPLSINSSLSTAKQLVLSWPTNYAGCTLQSSGDLSSTNWTNCASSTVSGAYFVVTNPISAGAQFFRLKR